MATYAGTPGNDSLTGTALDDLFLASAGNDTIDGGTGLDTLSYAAYGVPVTVTISPGFAATGTVEKSGTPLQYDRFAGIERVIGTTFADTLTGNAEGGGVNLIGGPGSDTFYGLNRSANIVDYSDSATPIIADIAGNTVIVGTGPSYREFDRIVGVTALRGSTGDDLFIGTFAGYETFYGDAGNDTFAGGASYGGATGGAFYGGAGIDTVRFVAALSDLTFTFVPPRGPAPGATYISSALDGMVLVEDVETISAASFSQIVGRGVGVAGVDTIGYYVRNTDVGRAGVDAESHYFSTGWREGRDPNGAFSTNGYLAANPDVRAAGVNPLTHYLQSGWREGRDPNLTFDSETYLAFNPDVRAADVNPFLHYLGAGRAEGRATGLAIGPGAGTDGFDAQFYLLTYRDVAAAGVDAEAHYRTVGYHEGRSPDAFFDTAGYLNAYADVRAAGVDPLTHYLTSGWREGRDPSRAFDTTGYRAANPDVAAAGINPLLHHLGAGHAEGRVPINDNVFDQP